MEDNGVGDKELLMAGSNERYRKICKWVWFILEDEKQNGNRGQAEKRLYKSVTRTMQY